MSAALIGLQQASVHFGELPALQAIDLQIHRGDRIALVGANGAGMSTVRVSGITNDSTPGQRINDPTSPDADAKGMVTMPNVNLAYEMVDLISASRAYEANLTVAKNSRQMAMRTLEIGK